jgi:predicted nucleotidyltransferase
VVRTKQEVIDLSKKFGYLVSSLFDDVEVRLFGSYYLGSPNANSDIDLAIISPDFVGMNYILSLKVLNRLKNKIALDIEPISLTPAEFSQPQLGSIAYAVKKGNELLYKSPKLF